MSKLFYFDLDIAVEYGVDEAILMHNFIFWISKNKENGTNGHDGRTWTHQTIRELSEKFPFWTEKQIYRIVKSCVSQGLIRKGNFKREHCGVLETMPAGLPPGIWKGPFTPYLSRSIFFDLVKVFLSSPFTTIR